MREVVPLAWNVDLCRSFLHVLDPRDNGGRHEERQVADRVDVAEGAESQGRLMQGMRFFQVAPSHL